MARWHFTAAKTGYVARLCCVVALLLFVCSHAVFSKPVAAISSTTFLNSIGVVTSFPDRGQPIAKTVAMIRYCGIRWVRAGIEGLTNSGPTTTATVLELHRDAGVKFSWGLVSGGTDIKKLLATGRVLAKADAILAFEGDNEPNNWSVIYNGEKGGGRGSSWIPVAKLQRDLFDSVKNDSALSHYPVWSISEPGAERDNVGLQFLRIPNGAGTLMPSGTKYADFANVHNYIFHPNSPHLEDNKTWDAADPTSASRVDGLFGNFGLTWAMRYRGYTESQLALLPRVTTETGLPVTRTITEKVQGLSLMNMYLAQFTRGYAYTSVYLLRDRTDEGVTRRSAFLEPIIRPGRQPYTSIISLPS